MPSAFLYSHRASPTSLSVTVLTPLLTARAVAVEDGSAHARWLGRRWVGGWFFGGCSRRRLSRRAGTAAQATALVGSCGAGRFAPAAAGRRRAWSRLLSSGRGPKLCRRAITAGRKGGWALLLVGGRFGAATKATTA